MNFSSTLRGERLHGIQVIEDLVRRWSPVGVEGHISLIPAVTWHGYLQLRFDGSRRAASMLAISRPFQETLLQCGVTAKPALELVRAFLREIAPDEEK